jgi:hypothetical protein
MKTLVRAMIGMLAIALLCAGPALAKKGKKGGGPQVPPIITAEQAKGTVSAAIPNLSVGKPFTKQGKRGDIKLEVPLMLEGKIVAKARLNPVTGEVLLKGQKSWAQKLSVTPEQAAKTVQGMVSELQVGAAWLGKQGEWKVPLLYKGSVVAEMSVHGQNGSVLPDWKAARDVSFFGR